MVVHNFKHKTRATLYAKGRRYYGYKVTVYKTKKGWAVSVRR